MKEKNILQMIVFLFWIGNAKFVWNDTEIFSNKCIILPLNALQNGNILISTTSLINSDLFDKALLMSKFWRSPFKVIFS